MNAIIRYIYIYIYFYFQDVRRLSVSLTPLLTRRRIRVKREIFSNRLKCALNGVHDVHKPLTVETFTLSTTYSTRPVRPVHIFIRITCARRTRSSFHTTFHTEKTSCRNNLRDNSTVYVIRL